MYLMEKKVAVITGASSGIGRAAVHIFTENGFQTVAVGRNEKELGSLRKEVKDSKGDVKIHLADIRETSQVERLINETVENFGQIDVLVNSAGIIANGTIENTTLDDWDKMLNINLRSIFYMMKICVPHLEKTKETSSMFRALPERARFRMFLHIAFQKPRSIN